jgi:hypothetical protein
LTGLPGLTIADARTRRGKSNERQRASSFDSDSVAWDNGVMIWQTLDDPPVPDQLRSWAQARTGGRRWYIWRGTVLFTLLWSALCLAAQVLASWTLGKEYDFSAGIEIFPLGPFVSWLCLREQWTKNEKVYAKNGGPSVGSESGK